MRVKICGITNREDAEAAVAAGVDALGFILYEKSKRFIPIEDAIQIVEALPPFVQTVAVTVNAVKEFTNLGWRKQLKNFGIAQLHGEESPGHVKAVSKYLPVIKVLPAQMSIALPANMTGQIEHTITLFNRFKDVRQRLGKAFRREATPTEISKEMGVAVECVHTFIQLAREQFPDATRFFAEYQRTSEYDSLVSAFMLDTPSQERGGTGRVFDWNLAVEFAKRITKPLILSGGLNPENVAKAIETVHPYAVDVNSGVEASPGRKDHARLRDFIQICKSF